MNVPRSYYCMVKNIAVLWMMLLNHYLVIGATSNRTGVSSIAQHSKEELGQGNVYPADDHDASISGDHAEIEIFPACPPFNITIVSQCS